VVAARDGETSPGLLPAAVRGQPAGQFRQSRMATRSAAIPPRCRESTGEPPRRLAPPTHSAPLSLASTGLTIWLPAVRCGLFAESRSGGTSVMSPAVPDRDEPRASARRAARGCRTRNDWCVPCRTAIGRSAYAAGGEIGQRRDVGRAEPAARPVTSGGSSSRGTGWPIYLLSRDLLRGGSMTVGRRLSMNGCHVKEGGYLRSGRLVSFVSPQADAVSTHPRMARRPTDGRGRIYAPMSRAGY